MSLTAENLLNHSEQEIVIDTIRKAELLSSGEIRVHLETFTEISVLERATQLFLALGMQETAHRNGVLIYVAVSQHKFSIIGDIGIHDFVLDAFWEKQAAILNQYFKDKCYLEGLCKVITNLGSELKEHFPLEDNRKNPDELTNEISFG